MDAPKESIGEPNDLLDIDLEETRSPSYAKRSSEQASSALRSPKDDSPEQSTADEPSRQVNHLGGMNGRSRAGSTQEQNADTTGGSLLARKLISSGQRSGNLVHPGTTEETGRALPLAPDQPNLEPDQVEEESWLALILKETVETLVLAIVIFLLIRVGIQNYRIEGSSMEPNFHDGEYLLVNKLAYRLGDYNRGDVIVFRYPGDTSKDYIKRVIGLPGDTIEIRDQQLYVNGVRVDEPYNVTPMSSIPSEPVVVEPDHLYVLGDNRPASSDTRDWGLLDEDLVIGKAWLAIWPIPEFGLVHHPDLELTPTMARGP